MSAGRWLRQVSRDDPALRPDAAHGDELRRLRSRAVVESRRAVGLDFVSVAAAGDDRYLLGLHFVSAGGRFIRALPGDLDASNLRIAPAAGGGAAPGVVVESVRDGDDGRSLLVVTLRVEGEARAELAAGRSPTYRLDLLGLPFLDPLLSSAVFSLDVERPSSTDAPQEGANGGDETASSSSAAVGGGSGSASTAGADASVDYLARDFTALRRWFLDRMAVYVPGWTERNPTPESIALVELLAYVGDYLDYHQDAVATEAYLSTARRRISVERHAQLLDYQLSEGTNSRVWVQIETLTPPGSPGGGTGDDGTQAAGTLPAGTLLLTSVPYVPRRIDTRAELQQALGEGAQAFATLEALTVRPRLASLRFETWGARSLTLPVGTTRALLAGRLNGLAAGDVLILEQTRRVVDGTEIAGDPDDRQAVRLDADPVFEREPLSGAWTTLVTWYPDDALSFPLQLAAPTLGGVATDLARALGNVVLADAGLPVPTPVPGAPLPPGQLLPVVVPGRCYEPELPTDGLVYSVPWNAGAARLQAAAGATVQDPSLAVPQVSLRQSGCSPVDDNVWYVQPDLYDSSPFSRDFVVEMEDGGRAFLRFGDGELGRRPEAGTRFRARYRVGNGPSGNVGSESLGHVVSSEPWVAGVRNPMAAEGGQAAARTATGALFAPHAYRHQRRAVTAEDWVRAAEEQPGVLHAAALLRTTGSWVTAFVHVQRPAGHRVGAGFLADLHGDLAPLLMAGQDLQLAAPEWLSLEIVLEVLVESGYPRQRVREELLAVLSSGVSPQGVEGFFHPDRWTFAQPLFASALASAAVAVAGVVAVTPVVFQSLGLPLASGLPTGVLVPAANQIVRLTNDPRAPEDGVLELRMTGGEP